VADVDLIVPTVQGREASLERCVESFKRHTSVDLNVIVVSDSKTCGWGWKQGIAASRAPYVALVADDLECISSEWARVCMETVDEGLLPCPRVYRPDGTIESQGGDMHALGHILSRHTKDGAEVDFTTVPFCSRAQIEAIGSFEGQYACDVWVSYRGGQLGFETVLRHGFDLVHYQEQAGRGAGMSQNERDAMDTQTMYEQLRFHQATDQMVVGQ
jgi:glycosyltransferase involved in cell wall biosynthesis